MSERVNLREADKCPSCGSTDGYYEGPAGYYTCDECFATWAGDIENAQRVKWWNDD